MLCVFLAELFSDCRSESFLVLQAALLVLACKCRSLQLPGEAIQPAVTPECTSPRYTRTSPSGGSVLHAHAHAHYVHTGPLSYMHLDETAFGSMMCSSQTHLQPSPPGRHLNILYYPIQYLPTSTAPTTSPQARFFAYAGR